MEEKEKEECTVWDLYAHTLTHTQSLSPSASRSLTHTPGAPERVGSQAPLKSCSGFRSGLLALGSAFDLRSEEPAGSCLRSSGPRERRPPPLLALRLPAALTTIAAVAPSEAHRAGVCENPKIPDGLRPPDARPEWSLCATRALRNGLLLCPLWGPSPALSANSSRAGVSRGAHAEPTASPQRIPGRTKPGPSRPGAGCGSVPCALP